MPLHTAVNAPTGTVHAINGVSEATVCGQRFRQRRWRTGTYRLQAGWHSLPMTFERLAESGFRLLCRGCRSELTR